ncbi:MAG: MFS transporter [Bacteroidales bacterium]|nr:MFS transporter [Bacteroidales bacterium]
MNIFKNNTVFLRFWIATIASQLASRMHSLILIWIIYKWTNSTLIVGLAMIAASLPSVLISPFSGSMVDRHNKVAIMMFADFTRLILVSIFAYLYFINELNTTLLIIGTAGISIASAFFNPASLAVIPSLVKAEQITQANAVAQISGSASSIIGPLFGSAIIAVLGVTHAFMGAGMMFLISVLFLLNVKEFSHVVKKEVTPYLEDIKSGFRLVKKYAIVYKMILRIAVVNFFFSSLTIIIPVVAKANVKEIAYLMAAIGFGMLSGSLFLSAKKLSVKPNVVLSGSFVAMGAAFIVAGFTPSLIPQLIEMFVVGVTLNMFNITLLSLYQIRLPGASLGKIMSLIIAVSMSLQPISYGVMGAVMNYIGTFHVYIISGVIILISAVGVFRLKELNSEAKLKAI